MLPGKTQSVNARNPDTGRRVDIAPVGTVVAPGGWWRRYSPAILIALLVAAAYANSSRGMFVFDDHFNIAGNPLVTDPLRETLPQLWRHPRPLLYLTLAVNYHIAELMPYNQQLRSQNTLTYHLFNMAVHAAAALLLMGVVRRTLELPRSAVVFGSSGRWLATAVAAIWAVHPLTTNAVTYIVQRSESMMAMFFLLTLYAFIRGELASTNLSRWWFALATVSCVSGMLCKEVIAAAPLVVLLYDRTFISGTFRQAWRRHWRAHLALAATWLLLVAMMIGRPASSAAGFAAIADVPQWHQYLISQFGVILHYLRLAVMPVNLVLDYGSYRAGWPVARQWSEWLPQGVVIAGLMAATIWAMKRRPGIGFISASVFLVLAPTSSIMPIRDLVFEHRMYLPLAGLVSMVIIGGFVITRPLLPAVRASVVGGLVILLCVMTINRNAVLTDDVRLWTEIVDLSPGNYRGWNNLGDLKRKQGLLVEAEEYFKTAIKLDPGEYAAWYNLGLLYGDKAAGERSPQIRDAFLEQAVGALGKSHMVLADRKRGIAEVNHQLGLMLMKLNRHEEALPILRSAMRLPQARKPDLEQLYGLALVLTGNEDEGIRHLNAAIALDSRQAEACYGLGLAWSRKNNVAEAAKAYRRAIDLDETHMAARFNLAKLLLESNDPAAVTEAFDLANGAAKLVVTDKETVAVQKLLGALFLKSGQPQEAAKAYQQVVSIDPLEAEAWFNLGVIMDTPENQVPAVLAFWNAAQARPQWFEPRDKLDAIARKPADTAVNQIAHAAQLELDASNDADAGRFDLAAGKAETALALAKDANQKAFAGVIAERLSLYRNKQHWRTWKRN